MKATTQSGKAYHEIRKKILSNQLKPGTRLKEDIWSKNLGVSRMAMREVLNRLLGENLVVTGEKGGYYIKLLAKNDIEELRELREVLEVGALRLFALKFNEKHIKRLAQICDDFTNMKNQGYFNGACEADMKFHETLIEMSENPKLLTVYNSSHIPLFHQKLNQTQDTLDDYEQTDNEHRAILDALTNKNFTLAETILQKHFERGAAAVLELDIAP